jgi:hypothetical protein
MEDKDNLFNNIRGSSVNNTCVNCQKKSDPRIVHNHPLYYCKEHPKVRFMNSEEIKNHLRYSKVHQPK